MLNKKNMLCFRILKLKICNVTVMYKMKGNVDNLISVARSVVTVRILWAPMPFCVFMV